MPRVILTSILFFCKNIKYFDKPTALSRPLYYKVAPSKPTNPPKVGSRVPHHHHVLLSFSFCVYLMYPGTSPPNRLNPVPSPPLHCLYVIDYRGTNFRSINHPQTHLEQRIISAFRLFGWQRTNTHSPEGRYLNNLVHGRVADMCQELNDYPAARARKGATSASFFTSHELNYTSCLMLYLWGSALTGACLPPSAVIRGHPLRYATCMSPVTEVRS